MVITLKECNNTLFFLIFFASNVYSFEHILIIFYRFEPYS